MVKEFNLGSVDNAVLFCGAMDSNLHLLEKELSVVVNGRGDTIVISGEEESIQLFERVATEMLNVINCGGLLDKQTIRYFILSCTAGEQEALSSLADECILVSAKGKAIHPKTIGQRKYIVIW